MCACARCAAATPVAADDVENDVKDGDDDLCEGGGETMLDCAWGRDAYRGDHADDDHDDAGDARDDALDGACDQGYYGSLNPMLRVSTAEKARIRLKLAMMVI